MSLGASLAEPVSAVCSQASGKKALVSIRGKNQHKEGTMLNLCQASAMAAIFVVGVTLAGRAEAQSKYGPGVTDKEIELGTTMPFSGPVSSSSFVGRNHGGGINGRKIKLIAYDDAYNPPVR
jgi:hypothetical protein